MILCLIALMSGLAFCKSCRLPDLAETESLVFSRAFASYIAFYTYLIFLNIFHGEK